MINVTLKLILQKLLEKIHGEMDERILPAASAAETLAAKTDAKVVTPAGLKQFIDVGQLGGVKTLGDNTDLNTVIVPGNYRVNGKGQRNGPYPGDSPGFLCVYASNSDTSDIMQHFISIGKNINGKRKTECWHRYSDTHGKNWQDWNTGIPASTDMEGVVALATDSEVKAGTVTNKAITPSNLKQFYNRGQLGPIKGLGNDVDLNTCTSVGTYWVNASGQQNGPNATAGVLKVYTSVSEIKDNSWVVQEFLSAGSTTNKQREQGCYHRLSTTGGRSWSIWMSGAIATETIRGLVELATAEEVKAGTDNTRAVTPKALKDAGIEALPAAIDLGKIA